MKKMFLVIAALSFSFGIAHANEIPDFVEVRSIAFGGTGCPQGSVAQSLSADGAAMTFSFDSFTAEYGPGVSPVEWRKFCQISVDLGYPQGWQFAVIDVENSGYVSLEDEVVGTQKSTYYFSGSSNELASFSSEFLGPISEAYQVRDVLEVENQVWSSCGANRALNIKSEVRLTGPRNRRGYISVDELSGSISQIFGLHWRRCPSGE